VNPLIEAIARADFEFDTETEHCGTWEEIPEHWKTHHRKRAAHLWAAGCKALTDEQAYEIRPCVNVVTALPLAFNYRDTECYRQVTAKRAALNRAALAALGRDDGES